VKEINWALVCDVDGVNLFGKNGAESALEWCRDCTGMVPRLQWNGAETALEWC
jgi:hypothetical protein